MNSSWQLVPGADVLYSCDAAWWIAHQGAPQFAGLKLTHDARACIKFPQIRQVAIERHCDELLTGEPGVIGDGGNSGFQALNLAVQFRPRKIILIGFDMRLDQGVHWHGRHELGLNNPSEHNLPRWRRSIDGAAGRLAELGVRVINASEISALEAYPKMTLREALSC